MKQQKKKTILMAIILLAKDNTRDRELQVISYIHFRSLYAFTVCSKQNNLKKNLFSRWDGTNMLAMNLHELTKYVFAVLEVYASRFKYLHTEIYPV